MNKDEFGGIPFGQMVVPETEMTPAALRVLKRKIDPNLPSTIVFPMDIVKYIDPERRFKNDTVTITPNTIKNSNVRKLLVACMFGHHDRPVKCGRI